MTIGDDHWDCEIGLTIENDHWIWAQGLSIGMTTGYDHKGKEMWLSMWLRIGNGHRIIGNDQWIS